MEAEFWHRKWAQGDIGFHEGRVNAFLRAHFTHLELAPGSRIFLPLCGKTRDIAWLLEQGCRVAGVELSEAAITELFRELEVEPAVSRAGDMLHYSAPGIDIWIGDVFRLSVPQLGPVDAVYDRAALVALPGDVRADYARHLMALAAVPQLLITYEYDQSLMEGPPFSVSEQEVRRLYGGAYSPRALERSEVPGGLKGKATAFETAWLLRPLQ